MKRSIYQLIALLTILFLAAPTEAKPEARSRAAAGGKAVGKRPAKSKTKVDVDGAIVDLLSKIDEPKANDNYVDLDSANDALEHYLSRADLRARLLRNTLPYASKMGLTVVTSSDKKLRVFSWDTQTGGTCHVFVSLALFDAGDKLKFTHVGTATKDETGPSGFDPGSSYEHIDQVTTADLKTVYLLRDLLIGSTIIRGTSVQAYIIQNGRLTKFPIFKTKNKKLYKISVEVEDDSLVNAGGGANEEIRITENVHKVLIPLINKDNKPTGKYLVYVFDGHNFVFSGTAK